MYYRILAAPPGYGPNQRFTVVPYETIHISSSKNAIRTQSGDRFVATIEEARSLLPKSAVLLSSTQDAQFLELWGETAEPASDPDNSSVAVDSSSRSPAKQGIGERHQDFRTTVLRMLFATACLSAAFSAFHYAVTFDSKMAATTAFLLLFATSFIVFRFWTAVVFFPAILLGSAGVYLLLAALFLRAR